MSGDLRLPPSGRDFDVFCAVVVGGQTTRQAAGEFQLSQTRICQIVERVRAFQAEVLAESPLPQERQLRLAKSVAAARLDHLYGEMMGAWRRSQGETKKTRSRFGDHVTTTTVSCGDSKYPLAAMRLALAQAELGVVGDLRCYADDEEDTSDAPTENKQPTGRPEARPTAYHPAGDCSEKCSVQPAQASAATSTAAASANGAASSAALSLKQQLARRQFFGPVQTAEAPDDRSRVAPGGSLTSLTFRRCLPNPPKSPMPIELCITTRA